MFDKCFDSIRTYVYFKCSDEEIASDIAQDVFMKVWEKGMNLSPDKDKSLLYKMASDMYITKFRRMKVELNFKKDIIIDKNDITPEQEVYYRQLTENYARALQGMNQNQREVFLMSRSQGLKYEEIADLLGIGVKAVEKRMSGALKVLKDKLLVLFFLLLQLKNLF